MTQTEKVNIVDTLERYIAQKGSQNKVAAEMQGVSAATLSQMRNHNWENIADEMWRKVSAHLGIGTNEWKFAPTTPSTELTHLFSEAQNLALVMAVTANAGNGKTESAKRYSEDNANVFVLSCTSYWDQKWFLKELLTKMGKESEGLRIPEMVQKIVLMMKSIDRPLIILDEADKLDDKVLSFFITFYNELEDHAGIILMATQYLERKIVRGSAAQKKGYNEIYSRVGLRFIELERISYQDVRSVCEVNGITDDKTIQAIWKDCSLDIRRVKRLVIAYKRSNNAA